MRIDEVGGEFGWIARMQAAHAGVSGKGLAVPIGDDAAVLDVPQGQQVVVTTDMLVERIHFRRDWSDAYSIGWKTAAVNLSDLAAMGAKPTYAFLSLAFTTNETVENLDRLYDGFADCLHRYGAKLAGGDTNASKEDLVLSATLLGTVAHGQALTRSGARLGDLLLVTGTLGNSAMGLALLSQHDVVRAEKISKEMVSIHRRPQPRIIAAQAAAATGKVRAAMDISDGLAGDLKKLCAASGVGARVETSRLPISDEMRHAAIKMGKDPVTVALEGGEDYELLLVVSPADLDTVTSAIEGAGTAVCVVGEVLKNGMRVIAPNGQDELPNATSGWDHFGNE